LGDSLDRARPRPVALFRTRAPRRGGRLSRDASDLRSLVGGVASPGFEALQLRLLRRLSRQTARLGNGGPGRRDGGALGRASPLRAAVAVILFWTLAVGLASAVPENLAFEKWFVERGVSVEIARSPGPIPWLRAAGELPAPAS